MKPRIVLAGGSGFIGQSLSPFLISKNYEVIVLTRAESDQRGAVCNVHWDGKTLGDWIQFVNGAAAVVNLTGRSINCRHTPENRREIIDSRVDSVRVLGQAIERCAQPPQVFVQFAGVGIYGDKGERLCDETLRPATISWLRFVKGGKRHSILSTPLRRAKFCCVSVSCLVPRAVFSRS